MTGLSEFYAETRAMTRPDGLDVGSTQWQAAAGSFDPFAGDFGDGSERVLRDKVVRAVRAGPCRGALGDCDSGGVKAKEWCRVIKMADREGFYGGRICQSCLDMEVLLAMGSHPDDEDADPEPTP